MTSFYMDILALVALQALNLILVYNIIFHNCRYTAPPHTLIHPLTIKESSLIYI